MEEIYTPREPVTSVYHGVEVAEEYRWLEDARSARTQAWTEAQDRRTRANLAALPARATLLRRFEEILKVDSTAFESPHGAGGRLFALKQQPPRQQRFLVVFPIVDGSGGERVLVDPNTLDPSGATAIDWYVPSPDGSLVAVSLSQHGTEDGTLHLYAVESGAEVDVEIPRVNSGTAGGSLAWRADGAAFWYTRHPTAGERDAPPGFFQEVWFHELGSPAAADRPELTGVFADARIAENFLTASADGRWVMDQVQRGDGGEWEIFIRAQAGGAWVKVRALEQRCVDAAIGGRWLFLRSTAGTPKGQVLRLALAAGEPPDELAATELVVAEGPAPIEAIAATDSRLWVVEADGGPSNVRAFDHDGTPLSAVRLPEHCSVAGLVPVDQAAVMWAVETFVSPRTWWRHEDEDDAAQRTGLDTVTPIDLNDIEVRRDFATSADGTRVPMSILARPGTPLDGTAAAVLYGYGGYGISLAPTFVPARLPWLEHGGVFVVANIRGGGEYGEAWHHAGRLDVKQHCFDDFIACAEHLVATGVTRRDRLGIMGGSNGGLLVGAVVTQRPELAAAVVCAVPVLDALRSETTPNGEFNTTEFGSVADPDMFRALLAYSPYHNVHDGTRYPPMLLTAGELDPRVDAWHAKKMVARLQAANASDHPILLRVEHGGHGMGQSLDQLVALQTDYYSFLFDTLGMALDENLTAR